MNTDKVPRKKAFKEEFLRSEATSEIELPPAEPIRSFVLEMETALAEENRKGVQMAANAIAECFAGKFDIPQSPVRILGVRPRAVTEKSIWETFGDYDTETMKIRLWMRTAILQKPTAFGTLLSTLCHELCHHLDVAKLEMPNSYHTRGFYERAGLLYHHIRNTPVRKLVWRELSDGSFAINWPATMRGGK